MRSLDDRATTEELKKKSVGEIDRNRDTFDKLYCPKAAFLDLQYLGVTSWLFLFLSYYPV